MSIVSLMKGRRGKSGFGYASTAEEVTAGVDLSGKVALITGANSGLGQETARVLVMRGAHILTVARSTEKSQAAAADLAQATAFSCELSKQDSIRSCVQAIKESGLSIDILICNAGIMALPTLKQEEGVELQFYTNHIGHFSLTTGLLSCLSEDARVIVLSSSAHRMASRGLELDNLSGEKNYSSWRAYGRSKLANLLFAVELSQRFEGSRRSANAVHPGVIRTNLGRHMGGVINTAYAMTDFIYGKNVPQGAATTCYVATHPSIQNDRGGRYYADCNIAKASGDGQDKALAAKLWSASEKIIA